MEYVPLLLYSISLLLITVSFPFFGRPPRYNPLICKTQSGFKNILHLLLDLHVLFLDILISISIDSCKHYTLKFCLKTVNGQVLKHNTNKVFDTIQ